MTIRFCIFALCVLLLFTACVKHDGIPPAETTDVPLTGMAAGTTAADTAAPLPTKPTLTLEPVTTTTETITLYLDNDTGKTVSLYISGIELGVIEKIEQKIDGQWVEAGTKLNELRQDPNFKYLQETYGYHYLAPGEVETYTIPVKAWCGDLLSPGEYRIPIRLALIAPENEDERAKLAAAADWQSAAWYFTVTE